MTSLCWTLDDDHNPVPCSTKEWKRMFEDYGLRQVDHTEFYVAGRDAKVCVSTVFIGIAQGFGRCPLPVLFETTVFTGSEVGEQRRYCTWDEAQAGHREIVAELMTRGNPQSR